MRTVDAGLTTALTSENYHPYAKIICLVDTLTWETHDAIYYELTGTKCKVMFKKQTYVTCQSFVIERGAVIAGVETGLTTGTFYPLTAVCEDEIVTIEGSLFRNVLHISVAGDLQYNQVIGNICTEYDKTAVFKDSTDTYWAYEFLEAGKYLDINNPDHFLSIIRQKYLIFAVDNGSEEVLFYYPAKTLSSASVDWEVNPTSLVYSAIYTKRNLTSVDESDNFTMAYNTGAYSLYPRHNLGYIKSTENKPRYSYPAGSYVRQDMQYFKFIMTPDLRWQDGDSLYMSDSGVLSRILVKEIWHHKHSPTWQMEISGIQYFQGTEAGNMPADMINVAPFIPLYTGEFDGILSEADSYVQHALDTIDDHTHDSLYVLKAGDTMTGALMVDGSANAIQLRVQANATQTANLLTFENSSGTVLAAITGTGKLAIGVGATAWGSDIFASVSTAITASDTYASIASNKTYTPNAGYTFSAYGVRCLMSFQNQYSSPSATIYGFAGELQIVNISGGTIGASIGAFGRVLVANAITQNMTNVYGGKYSIVGQEATITNGYAFHATLPTIDAGTITFGCGVYVANGSKGASGTYTTAHGLYIESINIAATNYAIYTNSGEIRFGDKVTYKGNSIFNCIVTFEDEIVSHNGNVIELFS